MGAMGAMGADGGGAAGKGERLHLRVDARQKALLEAASAATGASVSAFVLKAAAVAAAEVLADRQVFTLDLEAWRAFDEALTRPASDVGGLRELLRGPTLLDEPGDEPGDESGDERS
jgi:uncharacterized protein (DUF1778 family)